MRSIPLFLVLFFNMGLVEAVQIPESSYQLVLDYQNNLLTDAMAEYIAGYPLIPLTQLPSGYRIVMFDHHGRYIYSSFFQPDNRLEYLTQDGTWSSRYMDIFSAIESIPYYTQGRTIEVYNPDGTKAQTVDVSQFALCNQNCICDTGETYENCPEDCAEQPTPGATAEKRRDMPVTSGWNLFAFRGKTKLTGIQPTSAYRYHEGTWLPITCAELLGGTYLLFFAQAGTVTATIQECP